MFGLKKRARKKKLELAKCARLLWLKGWNTSDIATELGVDEWQVLVALNLAMEQEFLDGLKELK